MTVQPVNNIVRSTITTISLDEISQTLDKGQKLLADLAITAGYASLYHMEDNGKSIRLKLYLYIYAIQSWDVTSNAQNYFGQKQLINLLSKIEQLFYICTVQKPC